MKSFLSLTLMAVCFVAFSTAAVSAKGPEIKFESEVIDYGKIAHNADGAREFVFKNVGNAPLIVISCSGSCGCTVPQCPQEPIAPGATGKIQVKYDTNRVGKFTKTVTVKTNDNNAGTKTLTIQGEVLPGDDHQHHDHSGHKH